MRSLLYVSCSRVPPEAAKPAIARILAVSHRNNTRFGITGALLHIGTHFAQILEGQPEAVETIYKLIVADDRHTNVTVIDDVLIGQRHFAGWSMAYCGTAGYVRRHVEALLTPSVGDPLAIASFRRLMLELVAAGGVGTESEEGVSDGPATLASRA